MSCSFNWCQNDASRREVKQKKKKKKQEELQCKKKEN